MTSSAESTNAADNLLSQEVSFTEALGWAFTHPPTQEAFRRSTGEDIAPALGRYREWLEANIIGGPDDVDAQDHEEAA